MRTFTLKGNEAPDKAYEQMEAWVSKRFPITYQCRHKIKFTRSIEKKYRYNTKKKDVVRL